MIDKGLVGKQVIRTRVTTYAIQQETGILVETPEGYGVMSGWNGVVRPVLDGDHVIERKL